MQYSMLVFEIVFHNPRIITGVTYMRVGGMRVGGKKAGVVGAGGNAKGEPSLPLDHRQ